MFVSIAGHIFTTFSKFWHSRIHTLYGEMLWSVHITALRKPDLAQRYTLLERLLLRKVTAKIATVLEHDSLDLRVTFDLCIQEIYNFTDMKI